MRKDLSKFCFGASAPSLNSSGQICHIDWILPYIYPDDVFIFDSPAIKEKTWVHRLVSTVARFGAWQSTGVSPSNEFVIKMLKRWWMNKWKLGVCVCASLGNLAGNINICAETFTTTSCVNFLIIVFISKLNDLIQRLSFESISAMYTSRPIIIHMA